MGRSRVALVVGCVLLAACSTGSGRKAAPVTSTGTSAPVTTARARSPEPCPRGGRTVTVEGVRVRRFCGPARAVATVGETTFEFREGECAARGSWFEVHIGLEVLEAAAAEPRPPRFLSFSMLLGRHPLAAADTTPVTGDGNYNEGVLTFTVPGAAYVVGDKTVTLAGGMTRGRFTGLALKTGEAEPVPVSGRFACTEAAARRLERGRQPGPGGTEPGSGG